MVGWPRRVSQFSAVVENLCIEFYIPRPEHFRLVIGRPKSRRNRRSDAHKACEIYAE